MDYEKAYKEALERAKALNGTLAAGRDFFAEIFPELRESEDERIRKELIEAFEVYDVESSWNQIPVKRILAWLEKQKEQPKQEWSEEDEHRRTDAIYFLESAKCHYADTSEIEKTINWLKSLRPSWKPSEEQMEALRVTLEYMPDTFKPRCTLMTLQNDLKKLM